MSEWIVIPNWEHFQHYKDRNPSWIKLYLELNSADEWLGLSTAARGMLVTIWIEYARSGGVLRVEKCMQLCGKSARSWHLTSLKDAGYIEISASQPSRARSRETETEKRQIKEQRDDPALFKIPEILNDIAPDDVVTFASKLRDSDKSTEHVLRKLRRDAPFAVFASAYQALEARRKKTPALTSEVRYYVSTVQKLTDEWKREAYL